jgi:pimeloyl-ACP methyl ester carboxylesterase
VTTFVLIPGAGGDAWYWHRLVPELEARGHRAIAVGLPSGDESAGWSEYADAIERAIDARAAEAAARTDTDRPETKALVLVAQSLAGFSAPLVAERRTVDLIVLLNAMIPLPGETGEAWWSNTRSAEAEAAYFAEIGLPPDAAHDDNVVYFHDVPPDVVDEALSRGEPQQSWTPMTQPWPLAKWPDVPTRAIAGRNDRLFPLDFQRRVARERLGLEIDEIDGGHLAALSRPRELADRLASYVQELEPVS